MKKLRIILVLLEAPVPFGNAAARWYQVLLRELVARGHRVTCFAACSKPAEIEEARRLFPPDRYDLRMYLFPRRHGLRAKLATLIRPYSYMFSDELKRDLETELSAGYDILHLEQLWTGWLALRHCNRALVNVHYLFSTDLKPTKKLSFLGWWRRQWSVLSAERRLLRKFPRINTLSDRLRTEIAEITPKSEVSVVPLGIDSTLYPYLADNRRSGEAVISVIGNMDWYPTCSAAVRLMTRLWPEIRRQVPSARVQLVGWNARSALKQFLDEPDVTIVENAADIRPFFEQTGVLLYAPACGTGMKIKVLEAFGFGVPVVTTTEGIEGLPAVDGVHAGVCDDDDGLIARTVTLLADAAAQNRQRAAARALLESHCSPKRTVDAIEMLYGRLH